MKNLLSVLLGLALFGWNATRLAAQAERLAQDAASPHVEATDAPAAHEGAAHEGAAHGGAHDAGPVPPQAPQRWPAVMVFLVLVMFFMAVVIGPIVRAQAPPEMPPTHSHDEPPGASHHHGHSGTINPVPEDVARLEQGDEPGHGHHH